MTKSLPEISSWMKEFITTDRYKKIADAIKKYTDSNFVFLFDKKSRLISTPRDRRFFMGEMDLQPFYILDYIASNSDKEIWDIGCGQNWFKEGYNVIGVDPGFDRADIKEPFDDTFIEKYRNSLPNAFSICSIHFCSINIIEKRIFGFIDLVQPGGYVYISINFARLIDYTQEFLDMNSENFSEDITNIRIQFEILKKSPKKQKEFMENIAKKIKDNIILQECKIEDKPEEPINGNFRILLQKRETDKI